MLVQTLLSIILISLISEIQYNIAHTLQGQMFFCKGIRLAKYRSKGIIKLSVSSPTILNVICNFVFLLVDLFSKKK